MQLGSTDFLCTKDVPKVAVFVVEEEPVFEISFIGGMISIDLIVRDPDNRPLLIVRGGELRHIVDTWDVTFEGTTLTIRRGQRDVILKMDLKAPERIHIERAELWCRGVLIRVGTACQKAGVDGFEIANNQTGFNGGTFHGYNTLIAIGDPHAVEGAAFGTKILQRWEGGIPVPDGSFSREGGGQAVATSK